MAVAQLTQCRIEGTLRAHFPSGVARRELLEFLAGDLLGPRSRPGAKGRLARRLYVQLDRLTRRGTLQVVQGRVALASHSRREGAEPLLTPRLRRLLFFALMAEDRLVKVEPRALAEARSAVRDVASEAGWGQAAIDRALGRAVQEAPPKAEVKPWWVYVLLCGDGTYYTGIAVDVQRRFEQHRAGKGAKYTRGRGVLRILHREAFDSRRAALRREAEIKALSRARKEALIGG